MDRRTIDTHYVPYVERESLPYIIYKRIFSAPATTPRFLWVYKDGTWVGRDTKYPVDPIVDRGTVQTPNK